MADQKLNFNINLDEIRYLGVPEITDYKFITEIQNNGSNMVDWNNKNKLDSDEIHYTEVFGGHWC